MKRLASRLALLATIFAIAIATPVSATYPPPGQSPTALNPQLIGDGVNGRRVQMVYAWHTSIGNRLDQSTACHPACNDGVFSPGWNGIPFAQAFTFRQAIQYTAALDDSRFMASAQRRSANAWARVRWVTDSAGQVDVQAIQTADANSGQEEIRASTASWAGKRQDRDYLIYEDVCINVGSQTQCINGDPGTVRGACGGAFGCAITTTYWSNPGANANNNGSGFAAEANLPGRAGHELIHMLGATMPGSPYSGSPHACVLYDLMGGPPCSNPPSLCPDVSRDTTLLDCPGDMYYNPTPNTTGWLATHWNVFNSPFLATSLNRVEQITPPMTTIPETTGSYTSLPTNRILAGGGIGAGGTLNLTVQDLLTTGVPANASAVALNVSATGGTAGSYLVAYPAGSTRPSTSNINWSSGQTVAGLIEVGVGTNGQVTFYNAAGSVNLYVNLEGYYAPTSSDSGNFYQHIFTPVRLASAVSIATNTSATIQVMGAHGIPTWGINAVVLNLTANGSSAPGYLTAAPAGANGITLDSNVNFAANQAIANRAIVPMGTNGQILIYNGAGSGSVSVTVDAVGYFGDNTNPSGGKLTVLTPSRVQSGVNICGGCTWSQQFTLANSGVPSSATDVLINATITGGTSAGYLVAYPGGTTQPGTSDVNWAAGQTIANNIHVGRRLGGTDVTFYSSSFSTLIIDVIGYYS